MSGHESLGRNLSRYTVNSNGIAIELSLPNLHHLIISCFSTIDTNPDKMEGPVFCKSEYNQ